MQHNYNSEVEDLINPKDELRKKIGNLAGTIRKWNEETVKVRKSVREQLKVITDLGLNKYKMQKTELRKLTEEIFRYHGISESWLRKLLPEELKDTSKTRISYLHKQEIEKERQRLLQQHPELLQKTEIKEEDCSTDGSMVADTELQSLQLPLKSRHEFTSQEYTSSNETVKISEISKPRISMLEDAGKIELKTVQGKLDEANKKIGILEGDVRQLSEQFIAKIYLQTIEQDIPLIAQVDPVKKAIISIRIENIRI